jgi:hypothetical protein
MAWAIAAALVALALVVGWMLRRQRGRPVRAPVCLPQQYDRGDDLTNYAFMRHHDHDPRGLATVEAHPESWQREMRGLGDALRHAAVADVAFVHGTFVGTDPFSVVDALSPRLDHSVSERFRRLWKSAANQLSRDRGNFQPGYVQLFERATGVPSSLFVWSSENTHAARLRAACQLAQHLLARLDARSPSASARLLLVGHSHAGQIFALLLQLLSRCAHAPELVRAADDLGEDVDWLTLHLRRLARHPIDVVTLGTPVRYGWPTATDGRLLHIINHRGPEPRAGRIDGVFTTRDGDYIQQWGVAGSDLPAATPRLQAINRRLDDVLGSGHAPSQWLKNLEHRRRIHDHGVNLLVDYGDASLRSPNCLATNFGHAVYTRRSTLRFWLRETVRRFY